MSPESVPYTEVAAAVFVRDDGSYLLAQRPAGKVYAGYWEFPGGKLEPGEHFAEALIRELQEELGVTPIEFDPWITRIHHYEHASVRLRFFRVWRWQGDFECREFQSICWQQPGREAANPMLPANGPILRALCLPPMLGISRARELGEDEFVRRLPAVLNSGLRLVMLREKSWSDEKLRQFAMTRVIPACRAADAICVVNADVDLARATQADGVHFTSARLMAAAERPPLRWCGASCHDEAELRQAEKLGLDYVVLGPVLPTQSHPDQVPMGWERFGKLIRDYSLPVYALGGMDHSCLGMARYHGAHGIAVMRAAWNVQPLLSG